LPHWFSARPPAPSLKGLCAFALLSLNKVSTVNRTSVPHPIVRSVTITPASRTRIPTQARPGPRPQKVDEVYEETVRCFPTILRSCSRASSPENKSTSPVLVTIRWGPYMHRPQGRDRIQPKICRSCGLASKGGRWEDNGIQLCALYRYPRSRSISTWCFYFYERGPEAWRRPLPFSVDTKLRKAKSHQLRSDNFSGFRFSHPSLVTSQWAERGSNSGK
jgi:hypothetical protein